MAFEAIKHMKAKNPTLVGFFALFIRLFVLFWSLQLLSRAIFLLHRAPEFWNRLSIWFEASVQGWRLELSWVVYCMLASLGLLAMAALLRSRGVFNLLLVLCTIIALVTCIISFADAELYRVWGTKFNSQALDFMKHPTEAAASSSGAQWVRTLICTTLFTGVYFYWARKILKTKAGLINHRCKTAFLSILVMAALAPLARGGFQTIPINQSSAYYSVDPLRNAAAVNSPWNLFYYLVDQGNSIPQQAFQFDLKDEEGVFNGYFGPKTDTFPALCNVDKPNVVVFLLESFSSHTSAYFGKDFNCTPFLDSMAQTGLAFTRAYAQGDRTAKGMAALLSGWPGQANQTRSILTLPDKAGRLPGIGTVAAKAGYKNMFFYGGDAGFNNMRAYLLSTGFHTITDESNFSENEKGSKWGAHDGFLFPRAIDSMNPQKTPFFATILSLSSHEPFEIPGKVNTGTEVQKFLRSVQYTDDCIRKFFQLASQQPWFSNTVFVFVADHGRRMDLPDMETYQPKFYQIPIVFWGKNLKPQYQHTAINRICSQTDIPATLCESIFGQKNTEFPFSRNLLMEQPHISFYQFWDGFGVISDKGHAVWNNPNAKTTETSGDFLDILQIGKAIQWRAAKIFENL